MADDWSEQGGKRSRRKDDDPMDDVDENGYDSNEDFSDPEDFVDDVTEDGNCLVIVQFTINMVVTHFVVSPRGRRLRVLW